MSKMCQKIVKKLSVFCKVLVGGQAPAIPIPNHSQEHAVPVPLTLTLSVLERGRRINLVVQIEHSALRSRPGPQVASGHLVVAREHLLEGRGVCVYIYIYIYSILFL